MAILVLEPMERVKRWWRRESGDEGGGGRRTIRCTCPTQQLEKHVETPSLDIEFGHRVCSRAGLRAWGNSERVGERERAHAFVDLRHSLALTAILAAMQKDGISPGRGIAQMCSPLETIRTLQDCPQTLAFFP
jgi:hypothetical protein